jgi:POT family proton-dependent oligopeptide transporter
MSLALWRDHPRGLRLLFFTEMWERFSYYGMRAILVLAMTAPFARGGGLGFDDRNATAIYGLYTAGVYLLSLPGGWLADRWLGQQRAIAWGGGLITAGHFCMAAPWLPTFFGGMILIVLGTGLLKPNISAIVGRLYVAQPERRDAGFSLFYMGINLGAFLGQIVCGSLGEGLGWHYGFGAAGVFMLGGLLYYLRGRDALEGVGLQPADLGDPIRNAAAAARARALALAGGLALLILALLLASGILQVDAVALAQHTAVLIVGLAAAYFGALWLWGGLDAGERRRLVLIMILFLAAALFWSGFEQAGSSFNLFAERYTDRRLFGWTVPASWLQSVNPLFIILLSPFFAALWLKLGSRGLDPSAPLKFALGLLQLAAGFGVLYLASLFVAQGEQVLPTWLILTYLLHTTGELCLSPVGLSAVTRLAPARHAGQMMGVWFMAAALGNLVGGLIAGHLGGEAVQEMPTRFLWIIASTGGAGLLLLLLARPIQRLGEYE